MLPELEKLLVLQDRDKRIAALAADLERLTREEQAAQLRLSSDQRAVVAIEDHIKENEVAIKNLELDINTRKDTLAKLKVQQFETRKNEEFQALGHEIERYGAEITKLEDRELELMEEGESLNGELDAARAALAGTQEIVDKEVAMIHQRRGQCKTQMVETKADRENLATQIDPDLLDEFERLFKSKKGDAVAELEGGVCKGCHMKVTPVTSSAVAAEQHVAHCDTCGRMLSAG